MDAMIVLISVFAIFLPALILPGPDFVAVVRSAMTKGISAGLLTTCGVAIGLGFYATLSLLGLSAILTEYQWLAWMVRVLGGSYLVILGIRLLFSKPEQLNVEIADQEDEPDTLSGPIRRSYGNPLMFGFFVTLTNPKAIVLFASVFATAVTTETPGWVMGLMVVLVIASALAWYSIVSLFMASAPVIRRFSKARHRIEQMAGVCFVAIGGRILADSRNPVTP